MGKFALFLRINNVSNSSYLSVFKKGYTSVGKTIGSEIKALMMTKVFNRLIMAEFYNWPKKTVIWLR